MKRFNVMIAKPYFDKQSNSQKTKWVKIGSAVEMTGTDGKLKTFGDIEALPTGTWWDGSFQLFENEQQQNQQQPQGQQGNYQQQNQQQPQGQQGNYQQQQNYNNPPQR